MKSSRRDFLLHFGAAAAFTGCGGITGSMALQARRRDALIAAAKARKMNILFIMTDDHAAHAISAYGSRINKTPHIDAMAREGMIFSNVMCTNPICAPSRACILTGQYGHKNGVPVFVGLSPEIETVGGYLRKSGYHTSLIGKLHCGGPNAVRRNDWDRWMIYQGQGVYNDPWFYVPSPDGKIAKKVYKGEYATENLTKVCQEVLDEARSSGKPFFMMMLHKAPHRNWIASNKYRARFRAMTLDDIPLPDTIFDDFKGRASPIRNTAMTLLKDMRPGMDLKLAEFFSEGHVFKFEGKTYSGKRNAQGEFVNAWPDGMDDRAKIALSYLRYMQDYLACVQSVDDSVGEMNAYLRKHGMEENTLVVYTSDQGFFLGDHGLYDKRFMMEETLKMPFIAKCPALIKPGSTNDDIITNVDFAPTFVDLASGEKPAAMQGDSFVDNMGGETPDGWKESCYCRYYVEGGEHKTAAWYGVRTKTDKLIYYYKRDEWEYFDIQKDPEELENMYDDPSKAGRIKELKTLIRKLREKYGDNDQYINCSEYSL